MKNSSQDIFYDLKEALCHMHVSELKSLLISLKLSNKAFNKNELVERLIYYAKTGKELPALKIPEISKAKKYINYSLAPNTLILYGSYKNDLATRKFFQQIIGNHFHFTAYGIDWLRERWLAGNPPTYAEFAKEWQDEFERNKKQNRPPKQEWAYIRFSQEFLMLYPEASKTEVNIAWENKRQEIIKYIKQYFENNK